MEHLGLMQTWAFTNIWLNCCCCPVLKIFSPVTLSASSFSLLQLAIELAYKGCCQQITEEGHFKSHLP